jgi:sialic acid synthase SpsE
VKIEKAQRKAKMIKFNKYNVTDTVSKKKARVYYSINNRADGRKCVTLYTKDYTNCLGDIFADNFVDNTDTMTDYFEKGKVTLFEGHPEYSKALEMATNR